MMKKPALIATTALTALLFSACGNSSKTAADTSDSVAQINIDSTTIVVSLDTAAQPDSADAD